MGRTFESYLAELAVRGPRRDREITTAQARVLVCLSHGLSEREAADALGLSYETVHTQVANARARLAAKNAAHAVAIALRLHLID